MRNGFWFTAYCFISRCSRPLIIALSCVVFCGRRVTLVYVVLLLIYPGTNIVFKKLEKLLVVSAIHWPLNSNYHTKTSKIILYLSVSVRLFSPNSYSLLGYGLDIQQSTNSLMSSYATLNHEFFFWPRIAMTIFFFCSSATNLRSLSLRCRVPVRDCAQQNIGREGTFDRKEHRKQATWYPIRQ